MTAPVLAVFSGTDVDPELFEEALAIAKHDGRPLVLLDVRHQQQAERLSEYLESSSLLGRGTVKALRRSVKLQRDRAIRRTLAEMVVQAGKQGVAVEVQEEKGRYRESILDTVRRIGAEVVVLSAGAEGDEVCGEFTVVRV